MGPPNSYAQPTPSQIERCKSLVGEAFANVVERDGFAFYKDQRIRSVHPESFAAVAQLWPLDGEVGHIFLIRWAPAERTRS